MRGFSKSDVEFHSDGFRKGNPAVNVKNYGRLTDDMLRDVATDTGNEPETFVEWWHDQVDENPEQYQWAEDAASEDGYEQAKELAREIFGPVDVWGEGRSGGWLVIPDLSDVDSWDAIDLNRWSIWATRTRAIADDQNYRIAWLICANSFEEWLDDQARRLAGPSSPALIGTTA